MALAYPVGHVVVVLLPFLALAGGVGAVHGVAQDVAAERIALQGLDRLEERTWQRRDALGANVLIGGAIEILLAGEMFGI